MVQHFRDAILKDGVVPVENDPGQRLHQWPMIDDEEDERQQILGQHWSHPRIVCLLKVDHLIEDGGQVPRHSGHRRQRLRRSQREDVEGQEELVQQVFGEHCVQVIDLEQENVVQVVQMVQVFGN